MEPIKRKERLSIDNLNRYLKEKPYCVYLGAFDREGKLAGWSWGFQENRTTYYMCNSAVLKKHRRKGIYSALLLKHLDLTIKKGFQIIYSRHCVTNNSIIIPKLKLGFIISSIELNDIFGVLVHLRYYTNHMRRKIMDYRSGQLKPNKDIKKIFQIK